MVSPGPPNTIIIFSPQSLIDIIIVSLHGGHFVTTSTRSLLWDNNYLYTLDHVLVQYTLHTPTKIESCTVTESTET